MSQISFQEITVKRRVSEAPALVRVSLTVQNRDK